MASRARSIRSVDDPDAPPRRTTTAGPLRAALGDAYYHSWRLVAANVAWALAAFAVSLAVVASPLGLLLVPVLAIPIAAMFRIATRIVRGESVSFWDGYRGIGATAPLILGLGAAWALAVVVLAVNLVNGLASASPVGFGLATLAAWGLLASWTLAWTAWPLVVDPDRTEQPVRDRLRLAALLALAHPIRLGAAALGIALLLGLSTVAVAPVLTISVALSALWASHLVLPAADRLERQLAGRTAGGEPVS